MADKPNKTHPTACFRTLGLLISVCLIPGQPPWTADMADVTHVWPPCKNIWPTYDLHFINVTHIRPPLHKCDPRTTPTSLTSIFSAHYSRDGFACSTLSELCLNSVWTLSELCLNSVWTLSELYFDSPSSICPECKHIFRTLLWWRIRLFRVNSAWTLSELCWPSFLVKSTNICPKCNLTFYSYIHSLFHYLPINFECPLSISFSPLSICKRKPSRPYMYKILSPFPLSSFVEASVVQW